MTMNKRYKRAALPIMAGLMALGTSATNVSAQEQYSFLFSDHSVGRTVSRLISPLEVTLEIERAGLRISGNDRSEICAVFRNLTSNEWSGGYRLTDRDENNTHASLRIPGFGSVRRCETLNPQMRYYLVLRRHGSGV